MWERVAFYHECRSALWCDWIAPMNAASPIVSLLFPSGASMPLASPAPYDEDLGISTIVGALDLDGRHRRVIGGILAALVADPAVIAYRQDVLDDLLRDSALADRLVALLPPLGEIAGTTPVNRWNENAPLLQVAARLAELECYVHCVDGLAAALEAAADLRSEGLQRLRAMLAMLRATPEYGRLAAVLPGLRAQMEQAGSVTIGVNLDSQLRPEAATIVSVNAERFAGRGTLIDRLFGERPAADAIRGISALFKADESQPHTPAHELFRELDRLLERVAAPVAETVKRFARLQTAPLAALEPELSFYLGAVRLVRQLDGIGLPLARAAIAPAAEHVTIIRQAYNLDLALRLCAKGGAAAARAIVPSDIVLEPGAPIGVLSGPNSGGKTTYIRAVGQAQVLFQAGLPVPGASARISPVDAIYTHFPSREQLDQDGGRLAEELCRLAHIFDSATSDSLILLNEPFTSTDHESALAIGGDVLAGLRLLGARAIIVTHLRELACNALIDETPGAGIVSLVAGVVLGPSAETWPSFRIERGVPLAPRNAMELARRHGLSRDQLLERLGGAHQPSPESNGGREPPSIDKAPESASRPSLTASGVSGAPKP